MIEATQYDDEETIQEISKKKRFESPIYWPATSAIPNPLLPIGVTQYEFCRPELPSPIQLTHVEHWPDGDIPLPIKKKGIEQDPFAIAPILVDLARKLINNEIYLYIHCRAGLGRTGVARIALRHAMRFLAGKPALPPPITCWAHIENPTATGSKPRIN